MLRKEMKDVLKQTALILSFLLLIPVVHWINEIRLPGGTSSLLDYMINGGFLVFAMLIAGLAYMMFSREDNDGAMEYLKTIPFSKWELLKIKILPRLVILLIPVLAIVIYVALPSITIIDLLFQVITPILLTILIALILGFFLGLSDRRNPILVGSMILLTSYPVFFGSIIAIKISQYIVSQTHTEYSVFLYGLVYFIAVIIPVLIPLYLLFPVYKSWDCTSGKIRSQAILKRLAVPVILIVVLWGILLP